MTVEHLKKMPKVSEPDSGIITDLLYMGIKYKPVPAQSNDAKWHYPKRSVLPLPTGKI